MLKILVLDDKKTKLSLSRVEDRSGQGSYFFTIFFCFKWRVSYLSLSVVAALNSPSGTRSRISDLRFTRRGGKEGGVGNRKAWKNCFTDKITVPLHQQTRRAEQKQYH